MSQVFPSKFDFADTHHSVKSQVSTTVSSLTEKISAELSLPAGIARLGVPAPSGPRGLDVRYPVGEGAAVALGAHTLLEELAQDRLLLDSRRRRRERV